MATQNTQTQLYEVASRIREIRDVLGYSVEEVAEKTEVSLDEYRAYESGTVDLPFSFIHKCALTFGVELSELLEGDSTARLTAYTVTRKDQGFETAKEEGILIKNLAPKFKGKIAEPYWVRYEYSEELQHQPIHCSTHGGQEFDFIVSGTLMVEVGGRREILHEGDSIFYNSSAPHGMIAVDGKDCVFLAMILPGEETEETLIISPIPAEEEEEYSCTPLLVEEFVDVEENDSGSPKKVTFKNTDRFNFGFDVVDKIAEVYPDRLAMIHLDRDKNEHRFSFLDMKKDSNRAANYFKALGVKKGDRVMLVLKRHYEFWFAMVGLHKLGAIAVPATFLLKEHDFIYRFNSAGISTIVCTADGDTAEIAETAAKVCPTVERFIMVGGYRE